MSSTGHTDRECQKKYSRHAHCLALYGVDRNINLVQWYDLMRNWYAAFAGDPDSAAITISSGVSSSVPRWSPSFRNDIAAIDQPATIELTWNHPPGTPNAGRPIHGATTDLRREPMAIMYWDESADRFDAETFTELMGWLLKLCRPAYGIGYRRPFPMPDAYAVGVSVELPKYGNDISDFIPEIVRKKGMISDWARERYDDAPKRHLKGLQRDVYPFNLLSPSHMSQGIGGVSLRRWIESAPPGQRGRIQQLHSELWLWEVSDMVRKGVREALASAGLLICRRTEDSMEDN